MNYVKARSADIQVFVLGCDLIPSSYWNEETGSFATVWGIHIIFNNGKILEFPDLGTKKSDVLILKHRLDGSSLHPDNIQDIIDDFLGEISGIPINSNKVLHIV